MVGCLEDQYWDDLVRSCMSCQLVCQQPQQHVRCTNFCVLMECRAVSGQYYDSLLKRCLRCAEVCGSPGRHPSECSSHCQPQPPALSPAPSRVVETSLPVPTNRGRSPPHSALLVYALLGLCAGLLLCALSGAMVVLLRRARRTRPRPSRPGPTVNGNAQGHEGKVGLGPNQHSLSSKDCLMDPGVSQSQMNRPPSPPTSIPTETCDCVHCFPDPRAPGPVWGGGEQRPRPLSLYQQAVLQGPPALPKGAPCRTQEQAPVEGGVVPGGPGEEMTGALRIVCCPSQLSAGCDR